MGMPRKITRAALEQIPIFLEQGRRAAEIADTLGCTVGTLRVRCSQLRISLRRRKCGEEAVPLNSSPKGVIKLTKDNPVREPRGNAALSSLSDSRVGDPNQTSVALVLPRTTVDQIRQRAALRGISGSKFAAMLLDVIVRDGLFEAVLDEHGLSGGDTRTRRSDGQRGP